MSVKDCKKYEIRREDADMILNKHPSVKEGVKALVDRVYRRKEIIQQIKNHELTFLEIKNKIREDEDLELQDLANHPSVRAEDLAKSHIEAQGVLNPRIIQMEFEKIGYSNSTAKNVARKLRDKYYPITIHEIRSRVGHENIVQEAKDVYKKRIFRDEDMREKEIEKVIEEADEMARKI
jgi:hypothetical protein